MGRIATLSKQNILSAAQHKPFTGQRLFLTFCVGSKMPKSQIPVINLKTKVPYISTTCRVPAT